MNSTSFLYLYSSVAIAASLFGLMILCNEAGFRMGRFVQEHTDDEIKTLTGSIQASILGLLALLLGFTFSMAMQRYDSRSMAVIEEANDIGTALLRVQLLPGEYQAETYQLMTQYIALRLAVGRIDITRQNERQLHNRQIADLQHRLWSIGILATNADPRAATTGAFTKSLNDMIDIQGTRNALLQMHVPEAVMVLLFLVFISAGGIIGYAAGLSGKRILAPVVLVSLLITLIVFIIIDLDRPKRGLIQVDQTPILEVQRSLAAINLQSAPAPSLPRLSPSD